MEEGCRNYKLLGIHGLHHHLHCTRCGALIPVPYEILHPLIEELEQHYGFNAEIGSLTLPGVCAGCRETENHLAEPRS
jgi:Fe2+ or Zn2+ uptake regulation protein